MQTTTRIPKKHTYLNGKKKKSIDYEVIEITEIAPRNTPENYCKTCKGWVKTSEDSVNYKNEPLCTCTEEGENAEEWRKMITKAKQDKIDADLKWAKGD